MTSTALSHISFEKFYQLLANQLPKSTAADRQQWAQHIVDNEIDLKWLAPLLSENKGVALRMLWLLTDIGIVSPTYLHQYLSYFLAIRHQIQITDLSGSFSNYWLIAGIPLQDESIAIDLLFQWLTSGQTNVTAKLRAVKVLLRCVRHYPELKPELISSLNHQTAENTAHFNKKISEILQHLTH